MQGNDYLGKGIYSVGEAARLSKVPPQRIRRWLKGYVYVDTYGAHHSDRLWRPLIPPLDDVLCLSFRDLLEVRFVDAFRGAGVSLPTIRKAAERAKEMFSTTHPFSTARFKTDGRLVFVQLQERDDDVSIMELSRGERYFAKVISPYLKGIEFQDNEPIRWWPLGRKKLVVLDPARSLGRPIVDNGGIPTSTLHEAFGTSGSYAEVASWFETSQLAVRHAVDFEKQLAA